jgi:hypothetical protein
MTRGSLTLIVATQLAVFLGTLSLASTGLISGEAAACAAIVLWFVVGLPLSYAIADVAAARRLPARDEKAPAYRLRSSLISQLKS